MSYFYLLMALIPLVEAEVFRRMLMAVEDNSPPKPEKKGGRITADIYSIWLGIITMLGLGVWTTLVHFRIDIGIPQSRITTVAPAWAALLVLGAQMTCLVLSAIAATRREQMGLKDIGISLVGFLWSGGILLLMVVEKINTNFDHINGMIAFAIANSVELFATITVWLVANRRPGGVIGGGSN